MGQLTLLAVLIPTFRWPAMVEPDPDYGASFELATADSMHPVCAFSCFLLSVIAQFDFVCV